MKVGCDAVEAADALQPPDEVRDVRAEDAAVGVQLVDHHEAQRLEELRPLGVMGQDPLVEHVRVGDDDVAVRAHRLARVAGRVAVEGVGANAEVAGRVQLQDLGDLVLRERLGGEEVERLGARLERGVDDRQVVAERLARGGRRDDYGVAAGRDVVPRLALVAVEAEDAALAQRPGEPRVEAGREVGVPRRRARGRRPRRRSGRDRRASADRRALRRRAPAAVAARADHPRRRRDPARLRRTRPFPSSPCVARREGCGGQWLTR